MLSRLLWFILLIIASLADRNFYNILGVKRNATHKQIKKAYRDLSIIWHPDKNLGDEKAREKYQEINDAYEAIGDEEKRRKYDRGGEEALKQQGNNVSPFGDIFGNQ
jgi:DnaJ-class molecular chaperone